MSKNQREPSSSFSSRSSLRRSSSFGSPLSSAVRFLSRKERASFSLSLSPLLIRAKTQRERERMRSHSRGDFRHPNFQNVFVVRKDDDDDDDGRSLLAERRNKTKDQNEKKESERNARARRKQKKRVVCLYLPTIHTFFMRHFERNFGRKTRDSWLHEDEELFTVARSNQERRVCVLFSQCCCIA